MRNEDIHIGVAYTCKVGRNTIRVTVTEVLPDGGWLVGTHTGRTMTVRSAERFVARIGEPAAPEAADTPAEAPQAEHSPTPATERDRGEQGAPTGEAGGTTCLREDLPAPSAARQADTHRQMSLLDAAAHLLGQADEAVRCNDLVDQARELGLWAPKRGGKTPDRTLYAAILREINTKGDASRFRKVERGHFALNG